MTEGGTSPQTRGSGTVSRRDGKLETSGPLTAGGTGTRSGSGHTLGVILAWPFSLNLHLNRMQTLSAWPSVHI